MSLYVRIRDSFTVAVAGLVHMPGTVLLVTEEFFGLHAHKLETVEAPVEGEAPAVVLDPAGAPSDTALPAADATVQPLDTKPTSAA